MIDLPAGSAHQSSPHVVPGVAGAPAELTVSAALGEATRRLSNAGVPAAAHDARELMAAALTAACSEPVAAMDVILRGEEPVPGGFTEFIERRASREPLQFILGRAPVVGIDLAVGPGVFIPRPETDLLIDWAASAVKQWDLWRQHSSLNEALVPPRFTILDLCSGPGTISLGVGHLLTMMGIADRVAVQIIGIEIDPVALNYAHRNLADWRERGEIDPRISVEFHQGDATDRTFITSVGLAAAANLVVSNPPYVPEGEGAEYVAAAEAEVAADPHGAVYSGIDGLDLLRPLAQVVALTCAPRAVIGVEHDETTGAAVQDILAQSGVSALVQHQDFAGRDRFITGEIRRDPGFRPPMGSTKRIQ